MYVNPSNCTISHFGYQFWNQRWDAKILLVIIVVLNINTKANLSGRQNMSRVGAESGLEALPFLSLDSMIITLHVMV